MENLAREARRATLLLYASGAFIVLTVIAMLIYPGGAVFEADRGHYLFFHNFFSDLGATVTPSGRPNLVSHVLFLIALALVGLALIVASSNWRVIVARCQARRAVGRASQVFEIIAGLGFVGIAATPWNVVLNAHNAFVRGAFGFLLFYILCLFLIQRANDWPQSYMRLNFIYLQLLLAYVVILFGGPKLDTKSGLEFQVAAQKIIVYASVINLGLQALSVRREASRLPPEARQSASV